jgi:hypothetical protein
VGKPRITGSVGTLTVAAFSFGVGLYGAPNPRAALALMAFGAFLAVLLAGRYGYAYLWPRFLRSLPPPKKGLTTIGTSLFSRDSDTQPGADEHSRFMTSMREPRVFPLQRKPSRLEFVLPRRVTVRATDLPFDVSIGKRGGYVRITKFSEKGIGIEEYRTAGDKVVFDVYF